MEGLFTSLSEETKDFAVERTKPGSLQETQGNVAQVLRVPICLFFLVVFLLFLFVCFVCVVPLFFSGG